MPGQSAQTGCPGFVFKPVSRKPLSPRETETLSLAAQGLTDVEISRRLFLAARTVRMYLGSARRKLNANNTTHAVALGLVQGLIEFKVT